METLNKILVSILVFMSMTSVATAEPEIFMTALQAQKKFGNMTFESAKFKSGSRKMRGEMAADLVLNKELIGKPFKSLRELLGAPDGYFENDSIPAYIISPQANHKDIWQIIFLPDKKWDKIEEIKIHKNCCG